MGQGAQGWYTGMTQRDGMGREEKQKQMHLVSFTHVCEILWKGTEIDNAVI